MRQLLWRVSGQRRHQAFLRPLVKQLSFGGYATWLEKILVAAERKLNYVISDRHRNEKLIIDN